MEFYECVAYAKTTAEALIQAGFAPVEYGSPIGGHDHPGCSTYFTILVEEKPSNG
jgi:hypothetical protein